MTSSEYIVILDTSVSSDNFWDDIIMFYLRRILSDLFPNIHLIRVSTHERISHLSRKLIQNSKFSVICWTNLLSSKFSPFSSRNLWKVWILDVPFLRHKILLFWVGFGWPVDKMSIFTRFFFRQVLSREYRHSVRDELTKRKLHEIGVDNVINTCCPTTWLLDKNMTFESIKKTTVVFTLTKYAKNPQEDIAFLKLLESLYENLIFISQQPEDLRYLESIYNIREITVISANFLSIQDLVETKEFDYVGTRLHMGIHFLNLWIRSLILSVDNRAQEIKKDNIGLPIEARNDLNAIRHWINNEFTCSFKLPSKFINDWKMQFKKD